MKIVMLNGHSALNSGDAAITLAQIQILRRLHPGVRLTLVSRTPDSDRLFYAPTGIRVIAAPLRRVSVLSAKGAKVLAGVRDGFAWISLARLVAAIRDSDLAIGCGGGYLFSYPLSFPGPTFWQIYLQLRLTLAMGKRVILFPQSFGPLQNRLSRLLVARLLAHPLMEKILVRETISLKLIRELAPANNAVSLCPDLALGYSPGILRALPAIKKLKGPRIAVTMLPWAFPDARQRLDRLGLQETYLRTMVETCILLHEKFHCSFLLLSHARGPSPGEDDRPLTRRLMEKISPAVAPENLHFWTEADGISPDAIIASLKETDLIISSRFHAAIMGMLAGIPVIAIGYHHKSQGIMDSLNLGHLYTSIRDFNAAWMLEKASEILTRPEEYRAEIRAAVKRQQESIALEMSTVFSVKPG